MQGLAGTASPCIFLSRKTRQRDFCGSPFACVSDEGSPTPFPLPKKICLGKDFLERGGIGVVSAVSAPRANTRQMRHIPTKERADLRSFSTTKFIVWVVSIKLIDAEEMQARQGARGFAAGSLL